ncbi:MAG: pectate lyase [Pedosphaera sp.]|nr:pectate lyase [Pedosphaera sp.]
MAQRIILLLCLLFTHSALAAPKPLPIISLAPDGKLTYDLDQRGNRPPDFSTCGYAGQDRPIPDAPIRLVIAAQPGDATARIQRAIDHVATLAPDTNGLRGAILLLKGRHEIHGALHLRASGIVLRGQGPTANGTVLIAAGLDRRTLIQIAGLPDRTTRPIGPIQPIQLLQPIGGIADPLVSVGSTTLRLPTATGLAPGTRLLITRPSTKEWIARLGMTDFGGGDGDWRLTWRPGTRDLIWDRTITSISGDRVTLDAPITTALETEFGGGTVATYSWPGRVENIGIENLRLESAHDPKNAKDENHSWFAITMEHARDAWVRQVTFQHFAGSAVALFESTSRVTVQDCLSLAPVSEDAGGRRNTFFTAGQQTLFLRCWAERGRHDFAVGHCAAGPNAFVQCESSQPTRDSGAIESWASGTLFDSVSVDGNNLSFANRGSAGQGAGWSAANSVFWNCTAALIRCANPPVAQNWAFGSWSEFEGDGVWRSSNEFAKPESLFAAQLKDRLGPAAVARLELFLRGSGDSSTNPSLELAVRLTVAARGTFPQLKDYIANAPQRAPIPSEPGNAKRIEDLPLSLAPGFSRVSPSAGARETISTVSPRGEAVKTAPHVAPLNTGLKPGANEITATSAAVADATAAALPPHSPFPIPHPLRLSVTNGWFVCDGKLLIGQTAEVAWWRGNARVAEATNFGTALTRFVPGRPGPGFTDDLPQLADTMARSAVAALNHNYGLWYDRRRDDHQRVRRATGDVWPPFYEQPFARTGSGTAWDGLSRYDLTQFNPWYWSRLREFAALAETRGLVLFHQNYFQHNILEAGAHWTDSPWRPANNINQTGFPEPPPYAGDKRIFLAEQFYDVTNPVRRELHRRYIRQCLDNFAGQPNVIQFTSAEFTGPKHFVEFWLDTIAEWKTDRSRRGEEADASNAQAARLLTSAATLVALSTTRDVQDAILADAKRAALVDVIDLRYWWQTDKGDFTPPGGQNLAPRQFERQFRGGRPKDHNLAAMAAAYRTKFPAKPVLANVGEPSWAYLCAGGSLPNLPQTTDAKLLAAIPHMTPWKADATKKQWVLRESGKQMLVFTSGAAEVDLSGETGVFSVTHTDLKTGQLRPSHDTVRAGGPAKLPPAEGTSVLWLRKESR